VASGTRSPDPGPGQPIQVFGRPDSQATRRCRRFFSERRILISFVDITRRPPAPAELKRFSDRFGAAALLDPESRAYRDAGLAYLRMDDSDILSRLLADPSLLRLPLVRQGARLSVGADEEAWKAWLRDVG
jgi:arsenate reductase-like glutaredoxin family protein